jgi:Zn-dependent peptidase ImmA (M78 family)
LIAGQPPLGWIAASRLDMPPVEVAAQLRERLGFSEQARRDCPNWTDALRLFVDQAERIGVLVMISGIVLNNTTRTLNVEEFRGFALADAVAPLVFVNGTDSKSAQMFTLAHELAHLQLGIPW